jgi:PHD/YefM family antitoxin component YafN of YafNO toxin-antitoxin module
VQTNDNKENAGVINQFFWVFMSPQSTAYVLLGQSAAESVALHLPTPLYADD